MVSAGPVLSLVPGAESVTRLHNDIMQSLMWNVSTYKCTKCKGALPRPASRGWSMYSLSTERIYYIMRKR